MTIERSDERFLLIVHFRFFDNVDILFFQFFHDRSERFFKLFIVTVVQFTYLFQCVRSDFLFFLYILVVILYNPVSGSDTDAEELVLIVRIDAKKSQPFQ